MSANKIPSEDIFGLEDTVVSTPVSPRTRQTDKTTDVSKEVHTLASLDLQQKSLLRQYADQKKVAIRIAPSYRRYFGNIMRVSLNGIVVAVPCNGSTVNVPEDHAAEIYRRMNNMDAYENRLSQMSRINENFETRAGALSFFS